MQLVVVDTFDGQFEGRRVFFMMKHYVALKTAFNCNQELQLSETSSTACTMSLLMKQYVLLSMENCHEATVHYTVQFSVTQEQEVFSRSHASTIDVTLIRCNSQDRTMYMTTLSLYIINVCSTLISICYVACEKKVSEGIFTRNCSMDSRERETLHVRIIIVAITYRWMGSSLWA